MNESVSVWWIRRDLRINNNPALNSALNRSRLVLPLFILDDRLLNSRRNSVLRTRFLFSCLRELDEQLKIAGGRLIVQKGDPATALDKINEIIKIDMIFAEEDFSPYAQRRDKEIGKLFKLHYSGSASIIHPKHIVKKDGSPYVVYTPFMKRWKEIYFRQKEKEYHAPKSIDVPHQINSLTVPDSIVYKDQYFPINQEEIENRIEAFTKGPDAGIYRYGEYRDFPGEDETSKISPYLRFGMVSASSLARSAVKAIKNANNEQQKDSCEKWLNEIIWREFYMYILYHFPETIDQNFQKKFNSIRWENDEQDFTAWKEGLTGYPFVDAGMRQLKNTGWMHNRLRMVTASFLVKNLLVDWRWGELWFMQNLLDGDPASNVGGWQWVAGTGTDAAPYFRVFNPITQSKKFDPSGEFIRKWVPELEKIPDKYIHSPWKMPEDIQKESGCIIGKDYPEPIIDIAFSRERALERYRV